jgi:hypothetical protein
MLIILKPQNKSNLIARHYKSNKFGMFWTYGNVLESSAIQQLKRSKKTECYSVVEKTRFNLQHAHLESESRDFLFRSSQQEDGPAQTFSGRWSK